MWARYSGPSPVAWVSTAAAGPGMLHDDAVWGTAGAGLACSFDLLRTTHTVHTWPGSTARNLLSVAPGTFLVGVDNTVQRTTNNGESFSVVLTASNPGSTFGLVSLRKAPDGTIYAATYGEKVPSSGELFVSTDNGATWDKILDLVTDLDYPDIGVHIHAVHVDPHTNDLWLCIGDWPNSSILRCPGGSDPSVASNWETLHHPTRNPVRFEGYPNDIGHQPIGAWFDDGIAYFTNDAAPWGVKAYNKTTGEWFLALDFTKEGAVPNYAQGSYGMSIVETKNYVYHGARPNVPENRPYLWRMSKAARKWELVWKGLKSPPSGPHGWSGGMRCVEDDEGREIIIVGYLYLGTTYRGHLLVTP